MKKTYPDEEKVLPITAHPAACNSLFLSSDNNPILLAGKRIRYLPKLVKIINKIKKHKSYINYSCGIHSMFTVCN